MKSGIYQIKNKKNGKVYVGQAKDIKGRWKNHKCALIGNYHNNRHLQNAFNKYGKSAFEFSVLEYCQIDELNEREKFWIEKKNAKQRGYNMTDGGEGSCGRIVSLFERAERSEKMNMIYATTDLRSRLSAAHKRTWENEDYRNNQGAKFISAGQTEAAKQKRSSSLKLHYATHPESRIQRGTESKERWKDHKYRENIRMKMDAVRKTEEYHKKLSDCLYVRWSNPDYKRKMRETMAPIVAKKRIPVIQTETGKVFPSLTAAAEETSAASADNIARACDGENKTCAGFHWRYAGETEEDWIVRRKRFLEESGRREFPGVICVETGQFFETINDAAEFCGKAPATISHTCAGRKPTCGGYHWKYADMPDEEYEEMQRKIRERYEHRLDAKKRKIIQVETGTVFDSLSDAARAVGLKNTTPFSMHLAGKYHTAGGYHWRYAD